MTTRNIYEMAQTWNNAATVFDGISLDVTDSASNANSRLLNLLRNGVSEYSVRKGGIVTQAGALRLVQSQTGAVEFNSGASGAMLYQRFNSSLAIAFNGQAVGNEAITFDQTGIFIRSNAAFRFSTSTTDSFATALSLFMDAANALAQRNGVNAQTFNIYNTFTNASNYERGFIKWLSNTLTVGTEAAGTGTKRNVVIDGANRSAYIASPSSTEIRDILISHGLMAAS